MGDLNSLFKKAGKTDESVKEAPKSERPAPTPTPTPTPAAVKPKLGGLKMAKIGVASAKAEPEESSPPAKTESQTEAGQDSAPSQVEDAGKNAEERTPYPDETPATQPTRELPEDAEENLKRFVELLDNMHGLTPEPDLASDAIKGIMVELKSNPQYIKHVQPNDVRMMIRTMRDNMGLVKITKAEKKTTRKKKADSNMMDDLASLGVDLDSLN